MLTEKTKSLTLAAAVAVLSTGAVQAEEARVSDAIAPGDSNSKWVVGGVIGAVENPYLGEDSVDGFISPNVEYRGERFFIKDGDLGVNLLRANGFGVGVLLTGNASYLSDEEYYEDTKELEGLEERDPTLDAGIYLIHNSAMGQFKVKLLQEITGEHDGNAVDANYTFDLTAGDWAINPLVGVAWASKDSVDHFFGVSEKEANEYRDEYKGKAATNLYTGVRGRYEFTENWDMNLGAYYVKLGSGIADSTIIEKDDMFITTVGVNYNF